MSYQDITLRELRQLAASIEGGGMEDLSVSDLAYLGKQAELVSHAAFRILNQCQTRAHVLMDDRNADNIPEGGYGIERKWSNQYALNENELAIQVKALDTAAFADLFEFVPEKVERTPARFKVKSTLKLSNWIDKLGVSDKRHQLEALMGRQRWNPKVTFRAVDPETGEVLE